MIRFIMWLTKGDTDPKSVIEYTNWGEVDKFANFICTMIRYITNQRRSNKITVPKYQAFIILS